MKISPGTSPILYTGSLGAYSKSWTRTATWATGTTLSKSWSWFVRESSSFAYGAWAKSWSWNKFDSI